VAKEASFATVLMCRLWRHMIASSLTQDRLSRSLAMLSQPVSPVWRHYSRVCATLNLVLGYVCNCRHFCEWTAKRGTISFARTGEHKRDRRTPVSTKANRTSAGAIDCGWHGGCSCASAVHCSGSRAFHWFDAALIG